MISMAGPQMAFDEYEARLAELRARLAEAEKERDELRRALQKEKVERFSEFLWRLLDDIDEGREQFEDFREGLERLAALFARHDRSKGQS